jgi:uncharacterized protein YbjT (DUF2867 family)
MTAPILILGSRGKTGQRLHRQLSAQGIAVRCATRTPRTMDDVAFDWSDAALAKAAFEGVQRAYVVAPTDRSDHAELMVPVLDHAVRVGVQRLVLLSAETLERGGPMMGQVHDWIADHAPQWAVLRPSWFMQNFAEPRHLDGAKREGVIYSATGQGRVGFIDAEDIARVAAAALTADEGWNRDLILTGPQALSYNDVAAHLSRHLGRDVRHVALSEDALAERLEGQGLPSDYARVLAAMDTAIAAGAAETLSPEVEQVTGVPPRRLADCMSRDADFAA